jgi:hypothetical protein|tara:strand:- start:22 stop:216 length:195 start_codon:yes stop_codon:yes gene_type:complete
LIKVVKKTNINFEEIEAKVGDLGIVVKTPREATGILFVEAYMFGTGKVRWFSPQEIDIISNIED